MTTAQRAAEIKFRNDLIEKQAKYYLEKDGLDGARATMHYSTDSEKWILSLQCDIDGKTLAIDVHITDADSRLTIEGFDRAILDPASVLLRNAI